MDIPTRDTDQENAKSKYSRPSSVASSLGLLSLDNIEDIKDYLTRSNGDNHGSMVDRSSVCERLENQRLLALKVMEKLACKEKSNVSGLPSYLLKPMNTPGMHTLLPVFTNIIILFSF